MANDDKGLLIQFMKSASFQTIQEEAKEQGKPIFIKFHAKWCAPCRMMTKNTLNNSEVADYMNEHFINYEVDIDQSNGSLLSLVYEVETLPTIVFVNPDGEVLVKYSKTVNAEEFLMMAAEAKSKFEK